MDFKEYLITQNDFTLASLAFKMWPNNKTADTYLNTKLSGKGKRKFTPADEKLAKKILKELGHKLIDVSKEKKKK